MTVKTDVSRFQIHDELTAPDDSAPLIKTIQASGGAVTKFVGVLAGAPAVLRAYTRMRSELRNGVLPQATRERIALAVAEHRDDTYSIAQHAKSARRAGLGLDEVSKARSFESGDAKEAALLTYLKATLEAERPTPAPPPRRGDGDRLDRRGDPRGGRRIWRSMSSRVSSRVRRRCPKTRRHRGSFRTRRRCRRGRAPLPAQTFRWRACRLAPQAHAEKLQAAGRGTRPLHSARQVRRSSKDPLHARASALEDEADARLSFFSSWRSAAALLGPAAAA